MKKKIVPVLMTAVMALGILTGCHGKKNSKSFEIPKEFNENKQYEITFWAKNDTNKNQVMVYEDAISSFHKLYPNITVNLRLYTDYNKIYNDVITNISTDTTPNVCITYPDHIATYLTGSDVVVPLNDLFADKKYGLGGSEVKFDSVTKSEIVSQFLEECSFDGTYYAIPYMRSTEACYINKNYVEKLGYEIPEVLTWDFIWEVSEAALEKNEDGKYKVNGQDILIPFIYKSTDNMLIQMLKQKNGGYSTSEGDIEIFNDTTKSLLLEIVDRGRSKAFSTFKIEGYPANFLNAGQCIFAIDSTAGSTWMGAKAPLIDISAEKVVDFETEVRMIPQYDVDNPQIISQGPSVCIFNKSDTGEVLASWLFAQYLLTNEVQIGYAKTEGYVPVTNKAQQSDTYQEYLAASGEDNNEHYDVKIKASKLLVDNVESTFVTPVFNGSTSLRNAAGQLIENVIKSIRRKENINDDYFKKLYSDVTSLYRLDSLGKDGNETGKKDLGPLPTGAKVLLYTLLATWICLGGFYFYGKIIRKKH